MARSILTGHKTQTRRPITWPRHLQPLIPNFQNAFIDPGGSIFGPGPYLKVPCHHPDDGTSDDRVMRVYSPLGYPPEQLWIRETWHPGYGLGTLYRADGEPPPHMTSSHKWKSPIHMPRSLSRLTLQFTELRIQRLHDIHHSDIRAEGLNCPEHDGPGLFCTSECLSLRNAFASLWNSFYNKPHKQHLNWISNPWVWVIQFELADFTQPALRGTHKDKTP